MDTTESLTESPTEQPPDVGTEQPAEASTTPPTTKRKRKRSEIVFVYDDLRQAVEIARIAHANYGGACGLDQLAAQMGQRTSSGAFRVKVSAARIFGLITVKDQRITVTDLGLRAVDDRTAREAQAEAFLRVPLFERLYAEYKNNTLPNDAGLNARIAAYGVPDKQVTVARQVFQRSADQAGFFDHGRDRLVMPPTANVGAPTSAPAAEPEEVDDEPLPKQPSIMTHPLIVGLLSVLPEPGEVFDARQKELWLKTLDMNLSFIYPTPNPSAPPPDHLADNDIQPNTAHRSPQPNA